MKTLHPAYFALVMATGIVSIATKLLGWPYVPVALLAVNLAAYTVLWILTIARIAKSPRDVFADLIAHQRGEDVARVFRDARDRQLWPGASGSWHGGRL